jgi:hypothetical protein
MGNVLLDHYAGKRAELENQIQVLTQLVFQREDKQLNDQEREQLGILQTQLDGVTRDIEAVSKRSDLSQQARDALRNNDIRQTAQGHQYRSAGEMIADILRDRHHLDQASSARLAQFRSAHPDDDVRIQMRAAQHMGTTAEATTAVAGGFGALTVSPVRGPIIDLNWTGTPFLTLLNPQDLQEPEFKRPRLVDPDLNTAAGPQAGGLQKGELPSKKWDYKNDTVNSSTVGNYINLSLQAQTWVPASLDATINQLRRRTERSLELAVVAKASETDATVDLPVDADAASFQAAVWDAMALVFDNTGELATWIAMGSKGQAMIGKKVDAAGRPLFPFIGPTNALGTAGQGGQILAPFGLATAITGAITDTTLYVGNGVGLEAYVYRYPILDAAEPSILGRQIAAAAELALYAVPTAEAGPSDVPPAAYGGIVKLAAA